MKNPTKIHLLFIIALLSLFIVFIAYRLWILSEGITNILSSQENAVPKDVTSIKSITFEKTATNIGINKNGIHGLCMYYDTRDSKSIATLIMCDFNNSKIYVYSELTPDVWTERQTLDVVSVAPQPTGVCVSKDGTRLIVVSRGKKNVCMSTMDNTGKYSMPKPISNEQINDPVSPSMTPDGNMIIIPMQNGPGIKQGVLKGSEYEFKMLSMMNMPVRSYFGSCINKEGTKIAYTTTTDNKVYVSNLKGSEVKDQVEIKGPIRGTVREVMFSKIDENVLFVTNLNKSGDANLQYSIYKNGKWSELVDNTGTIPANFNNTGFVIGDNNTVYISQYTDPNISSGIHKFQYKTVNE